MLCALALRRAEAEAEELELTAQIGMKLPETDPILHLARRLGVLAWSPQSIDS